jgi:hypothetical protein
LPDVNQRTLHRSAGIDINVLHLKENIDTIGVQVLLDILAHNLTPDIVRAVGDGRRQNAASISSKDHRLRSRGAIIQNASAVMVNSLPLLQSSKVTTPLLRSCNG